MLTDEKYFSDGAYRRSKRAQANGSPFNLYDEVLVVTDYTIFRDHQVYAQTTNTNLVFLYMRTYFAHYINGVYIYILKLLGVYFVEVNGFQLSFQRLINVSSTRLKPTPT